MTKLRTQAGQATVVTVLFLTVLIGATAMVLDVGAWFRADRKLQADSDASALAGAQALPEDTGAATGLALEYGALNGGSIDAGDIGFESRVLPNDTIVIEAAREAPGVFTGLFGIESIEVHARAVARSGNIASAQYVAPIVVNEKHPMLTCLPLPCFEDETTLEYHHLKESGPSEPDGAGSFGFINLTGDTNPGTSELKDQIRNGFDKYLPLGDYTARTGNPFSAIKGDLEARLGEEMLFPVYRKLTGTGSNAKYQIIGFVGFVITDMDLKGKNEIFYGYFTRVVWEGILSEDANQPDFGARAVSLIE